MLYPNKTFVLDTETETEFGKRKHVVIIVAEDKETAAQYLKDKLGFKGSPNDLTWLMDTNHPLFMTRLERLRSMYKLR